MLAYAAKGLPDDRGSGAGSRLRECLAGAVEAASGLAEAYARLIDAAPLEPRERHRDFLAVLDADVGKALAALRLVLAQPGISSQLIDNLNASLHVRAVLTDIFLVDEIARTVLAPTEGRGA